MKRNVVTLILYIFSGYLLKCQIMKTSQVSFEVLEPRELEPETNLVALIFL